MGERLEKLFTLTDIDNLDGAPVTIEAGGLIKDNKTGRVIARMYLKNCADKPLHSVLVGFKPRGEGGRTISGMRDYLYDASGVPVGEIFGDQTGILFDNNGTKSFSADVEEVDFEDGEYWDAAEARKEAEELKLIVPEEKEHEEAPEMWEKPAEKASAPAVWESEPHGEEPHSADIYGAAIVEQKFEETDQSEDFVPASMETRQLRHEERPALEEQTDAYKEEQAKAVIELEGPSDEEQPVIELGGPTEGEAGEPEAPAEEEPAETEEPEEEPEAEEPEPEAEEAEPEPEAEEPEPEAEEAEPEPEAEEPEAEPEPEEGPEPEEPEGPVRLADMYGGIAAASALASYASQYGRTFEKPEEPEAAAAVEPVKAEEPETVTETEPEEPAEPVEIKPEQFAEEEAKAEADLESEEGSAPEAEPEPEQEQTKPAMDIENPWAEYSSAYAPPLGAVVKKTEPEEPVEEVEPEPVEETPEAEAEPETQEVSEPAETEAEPEVTEVQEAPEGPEADESEPVQEEPEEEPEAAEPEPEEPAEAEEEPEAPKAEEIIPEEHIPTIEETIELPKAVVPEKSADDAEEILAAAAAKTEAEAEEAKAEAEEAAESAEEAAEEVNPVHQKADVVFAAEDGSIPSIIEDKEKALTGEDHSGRNLLNIVVFGGIALIILLVLLIKM